MNIVHSLLGRAVINDLAEEIRVIGQVAIVVGIVVSLAMMLGGATVKRQHQAAWLLPVGISAFLLFTATSVIVYG